MGDAIERVDLAPTVREHDRIAAVVNQLQIVSNHLAAARGRVREDGHHIARLAFGSRLGTAVAADRGRRLTLPGLFLTQDLAEFGGSSGLALRLVAKRLCARVAPVGYPAEWPAVSRMVRAQADFRCEHCGRRYAPGT